MSATDYYLLVNDEQTGPYSIDDLKAMYMAGKIPSDALWWCDGLGESQPLSSIEEKLRPPPKQEPAIDLKPKMRLADAFQMYPRAMIALAMIGSGVIGFALFSTLPSVVEAPAKKRYSVPVEKPTALTAEEKEQWAKGFLHGVLQGETHARNGRGRIDQSFADRNYEKGWHDGYAKGYYEGELRYGKVR